MRLRRLIFKPPKILCFFGVFLFWAVLCRQKRHTHSQCGYLKIRRTFLCVHTLIRTLIGRQPNTTFCHLNGVPREKTQKNFLKIHPYTRCFTMSTKITRRHGRRRGDSHHDTMSCGWRTKKSLCAKHPKNNGVWGLGPQTHGGFRGRGRMHTP